MACIVYRHMSLLSCRLWFIVETSTQQKKKSQAGAGYRNLTSLVHNKNILQSLASEGIFNFFFRLHHFFQLLKVLDSDVLHIAPAPLGFLF